MRTALYLGDHGAAAKALGDIEAEIEANGVAALYELRDCAQTWLHLRLGETDKATPWLAGYGHGGGMPLLQGRSHIIAAYCRIAGGQYDEARAILAKLEPLFAERGLWTVRVYAHLAKAECLLAMERADDAVGELWAAYGMAHRNAGVTVFAEFGKAMLNLLDAAENQAARPFDPGWLAQARQAAAACAKRLAGMQKNRRAGHAAARPYTVALTGREAEVLCHMYDGLSRSEMSGLMGITVHGIKKHINSIYTKLGATGRMDAIRIAEANGLLDDLPG